MRAHYQADLPTPDVLLRDQVHRCFHYDVDSDFVLHSNCRCSENVDVATDRFWPVVTMCRECSPFPEGQNDGNSPAH